MQKIIDDNPETNSIQELYNDMLEISGFDQNMRSYLTPSHQTDFVNGVIECIKECIKIGITKAKLEDDVGWDEFLKILDTNVHFSFYLKDTNCSPADELLWDFIIDRI
jgi:hypothetical protein